MEKGRIGLVHGFKLHRGAMADSMPHDHHNIAEVGTNNVDMPIAVNEVARLHGGLVFIRA